MKFTQVALVIIAVTLTACTDKAKESVDITHVPYVPGCVFQNLQTAPSWVCNEPVATLEIQSVGFAEKSVAGYNYMQDMAEAAALGYLAELFKVKVGKMVNLYLNSANIGRTETVNAVVSSLVKTITPKSMESAKIDQTLIGPEGRLYVLVGLDTNMTKTLVEKVVKTSMKKEQILWQEFKAQQSYDEMATGIAAMEYE